jgi:hypothetical protein
VFLKKYFFLPKSGPVFHTRSHKRRLIKVVLETEMRLGKIRDKCKSTILPVKCQKKQEKE